MKGNSKLAWGDARQAVRESVERRELLAARALPVVIHSAGLVESRVECFAQRITHEVGLLLRHQRLHPAYRL